MTVGIKDIIRVEVWSKLRETSLFGGLIKLHKNSTVTINAGVETKNSYHHTSMPEIELEADDNVKINLTEFKLNNIEDNLRNLELRVWVHKGTTADFEKLEVRLFVGDKLFNTFDIKDKCGQSKRLDTTKILEFTKVKGEKGTFEVKIPENKKRMIGNYTIEINRDMIGALING